MAHNFNLNIVLRDENYEKTSMRIALRGYVGVTQVDSFASALSDANAVANALDALTNLQIVDMNLAADMEENFPLWGLKTEPIEGSNVTDFVDFVVYLKTEDINEKFAHHAVPNPQISIFQGQTGPDRHIVNISAGEVGDYFDLFGEGSGGQPTLSDGEKVDTALGANGVFSGTWASRKRKSRFG